MKPCEVMLSIIFIMLTITAIISELDNRRIKKDIRQLRNDIVELEQCRCGYDDFSENTISEVQISQLKRRAEMLKFCYLCPLYQDKVQEDRQQNFLKRQ